MSVENSKVIDFISEEDNGIVLTILSKVNGVLLDAGYEFDYHILARQSGEVLP